MKNFKVATGEHETKCRALLSVIAQGEDLMKLRLSGSNPGDGRGNSLDAGEERSLDNQTPVHTGGRKWNVPKKIISSR